MSNYDDLLKTTGPVALTLREYLEPAHGADAVFFPATFAPEAGSEEKPNYILDDVRVDDRVTRVGLIDSVGSQANRIEPMFKKDAFAKLVPQVTVKVGVREMSLLDVGHRAADAIVRLSDKAPIFRSAFESIRDKGNSWEMAKLAPTTILFGGWDSRGTKVKLPRMLGSVIRAWDVQRLTRSAQYFSAFEKEETEDQKIDQKVLSGEGLLDSPSGRGPGGIIAKGGVIREATLNLIVLRNLSGSGVAQTELLQRYILGLALVAFVAPAELFLREGCLLVRSSKGHEANAVYRTGKREQFELDEEGALTYATSAAQAFEVGPAVSASFDKERLSQAAEARSKKGKK
jgi:CRISPR-associated protein Csb1